MYQSTDKVLILQYMDGIRLNDNDSLEAYGVDKQRLVEEITRAYAHQIYVDGFFNGDPHPGISILCALKRSSVTSIFLFSICNSCKFICADNALFFCRQFSC